MTWPTPPSFESRSSVNAIEVGTRVFVRYPTLDDCDEYIDLMRRSRAHLRPWAYPAETRNEYYAWLNASDPSKHRRYLICEQVTGAIAGYAALSEIVHGLLCSAYLGYHAGKSYAGRGYMREGIDLVLRQAFGPLKLHRVEANIQPENTASIRLVERLGFRKEGYSPKYLKIGGKWRDHERWAILKEEWMKQKKRARN